MGGSIVRYSSIPRSILGLALVLLAGQAIIVPFSSCPAHGRPEEVPAVAGLDSLASATLLRALDYLDLRPEELGFDKLYVEDDTFRLVAVERLLNDPLKLPGWQDQLLATLRSVVDDPAQLAGNLGRLCGAPDSRTVGPTHWPFKQRGDAGPNAPDGAEDARGEQEDARGHMKTPAEAATDLETLLESFVRTTGEADRWLQRAFAAMTAEEKSALLVLAPAFWGDWEEPSEKARKGRLHFELGAEADTTIELSEDLVLDLAAKVDRASLTRAARLFLWGLSDLCGSSEMGGLRDLCGSSGTGNSDDLGGGVAGAPLPKATQRLEGVTGPVIAVAGTPWGLFVVGGPGSNAYSAEALERIAFLIEPGGDDVYRGRAASAVGQLLRPFGAIVDLEGDDLYEARKHSYALGGAVLGVAALIDLCGNDIYRGEDGVEGAGFFGAGFLYDGSGTDFFEGRNLSQGAGAFGIGLLVSDCSLRAPPGPELEEDRAFNEGLSKVPGTGAVPIRYDENDTYLCACRSQGFASTFGAGLLYDRKGSDTYRAGGRYLHAPLLPNDFQSFAQGYSIGFRPRAGGGVGILMDEEGNDFYDAEVYAQGAGYWYSIGLLFDGAGNDRYLAAQYAQGAGIHLAVGSLWDRGGDDHYACKFGVTQGTAHDLSAAMFLDEGGDDYYLVSDGQGVSLTNSVAVFIDSQGDDFYATPGNGQGWVRWARGFCGPAIFLDLEGNDTYPADAPGKNAAVWRQGTYGLGIDLDRDLELPDEVVPEIVLTPEDSVRTVEELFETASIWEVGSAREKVRRARKALIAKGMEAVEYVVAERLMTRSGLEYRAILELAEAYGDSFSARILPLLDSDDERVQRNVIELLGDMKRKEARESMEAMLRRKKHRRQWTRIISALGKIAEPEAAQSLRPFLKDGDERRRIYTVTALASLRDTASVGSFVDLLEDPLLTVRSAASRALCGFGATAVEPICRKMQPGGDRRGSEQPGRGQWAIRIHTLGRIAVALRDSTDGCSLRARARARRVLMAELDGPSDGSHEESLAAARAAAVCALVELGDPETLAFVRLRMEDEFNPLVRRTYENALKGVE